MRRESDNDFGDSDRSSARPRRRRHRTHPLEWIAVIHLATYVIATTWAFGGQAAWVRGPLTSWGCASFAITIAGVMRSRLIGDLNPKLLWWAAPAVLFNILVLVAALNPNIREVNFGGETMLALVGGRAGWPSSARPQFARTALLEFDTIWCACFNIVLVVRRRRVVRVLLGIVAANAVLLAVFGTVQKLLGAPGLYFGTVPSPQSYFFASFVYHNHWGAFSILMLATLLGLGRYFGRHHHGRDVFHSPAVMIVVALLIVASTIPLSGSRSTTILMLVLLGSALANWIAILIRKRRHFNESIAPPVALAGGVAILALGAIWYVGRDVIRHRYDITVDQVAAARSDHFSDARIYLYRDTWRMLSDKPWFGWGMASYPYVFIAYNSRTPVLLRFPVYFHDAHSDWLQAVAEHGVVGAALLAAMVLIPLLSFRQVRKESSLPAYLLFGCTLIVAYALVEFPFGNFAVVLTWWLCFFSALHYATLTVQSARDSATAEI